MLEIFLPTADALTPDVKVLNTSANVSVTNEFGTNIGITHIAKSKT